MKKNSLKIKDNWIIKRAVLNIFDKEQVGVCKHQIKVLENGVLRIDTLYLFKEPQHNEEDEMHPYFKQRIFYRKIGQHYVYTQEEVIRASLVFEYARILSNAIKMDRINPSDMI